METAAQIEARLRLQHPALAIVEDGESHPLSTAAYETRIAEMVLAELSAQDGRIAADLSAQERTALKARYAALKAGTATSAQVQDTLARVIREVFGS